MKVVPDYNHDVRGIGAKPAGAPSQSSQCFLTTACCELVGLDDDCFELTALRRFRDQVMLADAAGRRDVAQYYKTAPVILTEMRRRGETERLRGLYFGFVLPCAILATLGFERLTRRLYSRMMWRPQPVTPDERPPAAPPMSAIGSSRAGPAASPCGRRAG